MNIKNALDEQLVQKYPYYPPPDHKEMEELGGDISIGIVNVRGGRRIFFKMPLDDLTMHALVGGRTGTGKSWANTVVLLELESIAAEKNFAITVPDTKLFYRRCLPVAKDLKVITFDKFVFNPLERPDWMHPTDFIQLFSKKFAADNVLWVPSENLFVDVLNPLFRKKGIFDGSKNYPTLSEFLSAIVNLQTDSTYGLRYRDIFQSTINRIKPYTYFENFSSRQGISHEVFATENIVLELPLHKISDYMHNFLVSWIANLTFAKNITLGLRGNKLRQFFLIDEARTILCAQREHTGMENIEPGINEIIVKGREFGLAMWLCSQEWGSFSKVFLANCLLKLVFPLTEDLSEMEESIGLTKEQVQGIHDLPKRRVAVCRYGDFPRPFILVTPELTGIENVPSDGEVNNAMSGFYARILPKKESVEIGIAEGVPQKFNQSRTEVDAFIMITHLTRNPFMNYGDLIAELNLSPTRGDAARAWMVNSGFVRIHSIALKRGKPGEYFELNEAAYERFGGKPPAGQGSLEHKCFCNAIKEFLRTNGTRSGLKAR